MQPKKSSRPGAAPTTVPPLRRHSHRAKDCHYFDYPARISALDRPTLSIRKPFTSGHSVVPHQQLMQAAMFSRTGRLEVPTRSQ
jgi:hypothetical protein